MENTSEKIHNTNIIKRCPNCLSLLGSNIARDIVGREFCSRDCLKNWWAENRKIADELYNWWIGRD